MLRLMVAQFCEGFRKRTSFKPKRELWVKKGAAINGRDVGQNEKGICISKEETRGTNKTIERGALEIIHVDKANVMDKTC